MRMAGIHNVLNAGQKFNPVIATVLLVDKNRTGLGSLLNKRKECIDMKEIIKLLPVLFVAIAMNIGAGLYYNIGTKKLNFSR